MRRQAVTAGGKTRITIRIDADVIAWFRDQVRSTGGSYQTLINLSLRDYIARAPLEATLRRVIREELARAEGRPSPHAYREEPRPAVLVADAGVAYGAGRTSSRRPRRGRRGGKD